MTNMTDRVLDNEIVGFAT